MSDPILCIGSDKNTVDAPSQPSVPDESFGATMFVIDLMRQEKEKKDRLIKVFSFLSNLCCEILQ